MESPKFYDTGAGTLVDAPMFTPLGPHSLLALHWATVTKCSGLASVLVLFCFECPPFCPAHPLERPSIPNTVMLGLTPEVVYHRKNCCNSAFVSATARV